MNFERKNKILVEENKYLKEQIKNKDKELENISNYKKLVAECNIATTEYQELIAELHEQINSYNRLVNELTILKKEYEKAIKKDMKLYK